MTTPTTDILRGGSRARLAEYRANLARSLKTIRGCRTPEAAEEYIRSAGYTSPLTHRYSWMGAAVHRFNVTDCGGYANIPTAALDGFRDAAECKNGWYADAFQDEVYRGKVWQLPARKGSLQFLAGYSEADAGYTVLDVTRGTLTIFDDLDEAKRAADHVAQHFAEENREYSERWQEASNYADDIEQMKAKAKDARAVWREFANCKTPGPMLARERDNMRERHAKLIGQIVGKRERIAALGMAGEF